MAIIGIYSFFYLLFVDAIVVKESFSYPDGPIPGIFWSEGCPAVIRNGKLFMDADTTSPRASSVWLNKDISGDLSIEYDVNLVSSFDDANNINLFFMYQDTSGKSLQQSASMRKDGLYNRYHQLQGYIVTNVTNGDSVNIRYRFRKNPGFKLIGEWQQKRKLRKGIVHIKMIKKGRRFEYWENGLKIFSEEVKENETLYTSGIFGFRTWHTAMEIDNLLIKKI